MNFEDAKFVSVTFPLQRNVHIETCSFFFLLSGEKKKANKSPSSLLQWGGVQD